ncbi:hypothetical protein B0H13DRAFT_2107842, partial [Mycena leptocephala]
MFSTRAAGNIFTRRAGRAGEGRWRKKSVDVRNVTPSITQSTARVKARRPWSAHKYRARRLYRMARRAGCGRRSGLIWEVRHQRHYHHRQQQRQHISAHRPRRVMSPARVQEDRIPTSALRGIHTRVSIPQRYSGCRWGAGPHRLVLSNSPTFTEPRKTALFFDAGPWIVQPVAPS